MSNTIPMFRKWLRFSLGTMLLLITVFAIVMGGWSNVARNQRIAVEALERAGARVVYDSDEAEAFQKSIQQLKGRFGKKAVSEINPQPPADMPEESELWRRRQVRSILGNHYVDRVVTVIFARQASTEDYPSEHVWKKIHAIKSIREAHVGAGATDETLSNACRIQSVYRLTVKCTNITGEGLRHINKLKMLTSLTIAPVPEDAKVSQLGDLPNLRVITLDDVVTLDDEDVAALARSSRLLSLRRATLRISDEGLRHLGKLTKLRELDVSYCDQITDEGLKSIANMKGLTQLELAGTKISDRGVQNIEKLLPQLQYLNLVGTNVSFETAERIRKQYPLIEVAKWPAPQAVDPR